MSVNRSVCRSKTRWTLYKSQSSNDMIFIKLDTNIECWTMWLTSKTRWTLYKSQSSNDMIFIKPDTNIECWTMWLGVVYQAESCINFQQKSKMVRDTMLDSINVD